MLKTLFFKRGVKVFGFQNPEYANKVVQIILSK